MGEDQLPEFATNRHDLGETVADAVNRLLRVSRETLKEAPSVAIATAYLNPAGFMLLASELKQAPRVRLLLGAEPEQGAELAYGVADADETERLDRALQSHERWMEAQRDTMGFTPTSTSNARDLVGWLEQVDDDGQPRVEVRRLVGEFLHGKAYLVEGAQPAVLAGSSNLTYAGLHENAELNLGTRSVTPINRVQEWFDHFWGNADPYDLAALYRGLWEPHSPWLIFLRMLWERYGANLDIDEQKVDTDLHLTAFQSDGVARMLRILDQLGGVLLADEVGLGKTYLAAEIVHRATERDRQRVVIICPASLKKSMWEPFLEEHGFQLTSVYSYEEVRNRSDSDHPGHSQFMHAMQEAALVVVDEAHNLRNPNSARAQAVDRVILSGKYPKKVLLMTATPVNNSLNDLETLIRYFVRDDAKFAADGIPSLHEYITAAEKLDPEDLTPDRLFDLMDKVAVRRTRKFIKDQYPNETIFVRGKQVRISFPQADVYRIDYRHSRKALRLVDHVCAALDPGDEDEGLPIASEDERLTMARYTTSAYQGVGELDASQVSNAGLLRSALLKRLESSQSALATTLDRLIASNQGFLSALDQGHVLRGSALAEWTSSGADDLSEALDDLDDRDDADAAGSYDVKRLRSDVEADIHLLEHLRDETRARENEEDAKAGQLLAELERIARESQQTDLHGVNGRDRRKVLVFSTFSDTIVDLHQKVSAAINAASSESPLALYQGRIAPPVMGAYASTQRRGDSGGVDMGGRAATIEGFAPKTAGPVDRDGNPEAKDMYDLLLTTDVLAEGVNLQQANHIINYDLPWNPQLIVQRHGRVDRIGSEHDRVHLGVFFPSERLDEMLRLEERLRRKLAEANAAVGTGVVLPGQVLSSDVVLADPRQAINDLQHLVEMGGAHGAALSGEEYRRRLTNARRDAPDAFSSMRKLPFGAGSGFHNPLVRGNGYVFCIKVADHPDPRYRFVPVGKDWHVRDGAVLADTLTCFTAADPGNSATARIVSEAAYQGAYDAWETARDQVFQEWSRLTDPNSTVPETPRSFRDAETLLLDTPSALSPEDRAQLSGQLRTVPPVKTSRLVRRILESAESSTEKLEQIKQLLDDAGITPTTPAEPLPWVDEDQIRLVAWMAVEGG